MATTSATLQSGSVRAAWISVEILWYLGWFAAILSAALLITTAFTSFHIQYVRIPIEVLFDHPLPISPAAGSQMFPIVGYEGRVIVDASHMRNPAVWLLIPTLIVAGYLFVVFQLRRVLRNVRQGQPFARDNARRLRIIGYATLIAGPVFGLMTHIYGRVHQYQLDIPDATINVPIDVYPFAIFAGLIVLVIAQVFDYGARLQSEQDLTV